MYVSPLFPPLILPHRIALLSVIIFTSVVSTTIPLLSATKLEVTEMPSIECTSGPGKPTSVYIGSEICSSIFGDSFNVEFDVQVPVGEEVAPPVWICVCCGPSGGSVG